MSKALEMEKASTEFENVNNESILSLLPESACTSNKDYTTNLLTGHTPNPGSATAGVVVAGDFSANNVHLITNIKKPVTRNTINIHLHAASTVEVPERIFFNVHESIPSFTGRQEVIEELHKEIYLNKLKPNLGVRARMKVICGMPGVGKTQTVRHYIQSYKQCYGHVIWINAEKHSEAMSCFLDLATKIKIDVNVNGKPKKEKAILEEIFDVVCKKVTLIVYDNVESYNTSGENDLRLLLPQSVKNGWEVPAIIVTTRNRDWDKVSLTTLDGLTEDESFSLLSQLNIIDSEETRRLVNDITDLCQGLPLVLQQVVSIVRHNMKSWEAIGTEPYTLRDFLAEIKKESKRKEFLSTKPNEPTTDDTFQVFGMTFKQLSTKHNGPLALKCLDIMALLSPDSIPMTLFMNLISHDEPDRSEVAEALMLLHTYNLVSIFSGFYQIHRIIQDIRLVSKIEDETSSLHKSINVPQILKSFSQFLVQIPTDDPFVHQITENGARFLLKVPIHSEDKTYIEFKGSLASKYTKLRKFTHSEKLYREILDVENNVRGPEHPRTLATHIELAWAVNSQDKYEEAEQLYKAILEPAIKVLGPKDPGTLAVQHNLAWVMECQGKCDAAEQLYKEVLEIKTKFLEPQDPSILGTQHGLAAVMRSQGKYDEAEDLFRYVMETQIKVLGAEHPSVLETKYQLALVMNYKGNYDESEQLCKGVLEARNKIYGPEFPNTMATLHHLALVTANQGKYEEAEKLFRRVLEERNRVLGPEHRDTLRTTIMMASVLLNQGRNEVAQRYFILVRDLRIKTLGLDHPETIIAQNAVVSCAEKIEGVRQRRYQCCIFIVTSLFFLVIVGLRVRR